MTATVDGPRAADRPGPQARRRSGRRRALVWVAAFVAISTAAYFAGQALHPRPRRTAATCALLTAGTGGGRALVPYADATGTPVMSAAIRAAVTSWNASAAGVRLVPTRGHASLTFRAGPTTAPVPRCRSAAARTVTIVLGTRAWLSTGAARVRQPVAAVAKAIGLALGLHSGGRCPALMAPAACRQRSAAPDPIEIAAVDRLYRPG